jgi:hypothetical protein
VAKQENSPTSCNGSLAVVRRKAVGRWWRPKDPPTNCKGLLVVIECGGLVVKQANSPTSRNGSSVVVRRGGVVVKGGRAVVEAKRPTNEL